jgi:hypothetical protein
MWCSRQHHGMATPRGGAADGVIEECTQMVASTVFLRVARMLGDAGYEAAYAAMVCMAVRVLGSDFWAWAYQVRCSCQSGSLGGLLCARDNGNAQPTLAMA